MVEFPVATEDGFPYGLRCPVCKRGIDVGQPYSEVPISVINRDDIVVELRCVYC